MLEEDRVQI